MARATLLMLPCALLIAGCDAPTAGSPPAPATVEGQFRLTGVDGQPPQGSATLTVGAGGALRGEGPCNAWQARNAATPPDFRIEGLTRTERACLIEGGEAAYQDALRGANRIEATATGLMIHGGSHRLEFARE